MILFLDFVYLFLYLNSGAKTDKAREQHSIPLDRGLDHCLMLRPIISCPENLAIFIVCVVGRLLCEYYVWRNLFW